MWGYILDNNTKRLAVFLSEPDDKSKQIVNAQDYEVEQDWRGNYYIKGYAPKQTDEELVQINLSKAKNERSNAVSKITVEIDGMVFDGDEISQERMSRTVVAAAATGEPGDATTTWVLHDNTIAQPTISQLARALRAAGEEQTKLWTVPYK